MVLEWRGGRGKVRRRWREGKERGEEGEGEYAVIRVVLALGCMTSISRCAGPSLSGPSSPLSPSSLAPSLPPSPPLCLLAQSRWALLYGLELFSRDYPEAALFARIVQEELSPDELAFLLYAFCPLLLATCPCPDRPTRIRTSLLFDRCGLIAMVVVSHPARANCPDMVRVRRCVWAGLAWGT